MKVRIGFVSNSSSSSFLLKGSFDKLLEQIGIMCDVIETDYNVWRREEDSQPHTQGFKDLKNQHEILDMFREGDLGIAFSSCNYDTYIWCYEKDHGCEFVIETCNNHDFRSHLDSTLATEYGEDNNEYSRIFSENRRVGHFFYRLDDKVIRSAEHYSPIGVSKVFPFRCSNKKCHNHKDSFFSFTFDENMQMKCGVCDSLITRVDIKTPKKKSKYIPDHIIPGVI